MDHQAFVIQMPETIRKALAARQMVGVVIVSSIVVVKDARTSGVFVQQLQETRLMRQSNFSDFDVNTKVYLKQQTLPHREYMSFGKLPTHVKQGM